MILLSTSTTLQIALDGVPGTEFDWNVTYIDTTDDTPKQANGVSNGTTDVTVLGSPASDERLVRFFSIFNADNTARTVTIKIDTGANERIITKQNLDPNSSLIYDSESGWNVTPIDSSGGADSKKIKVSADDTTENWLEDKLTNNGNISFTTENPGANESIKADAPDASTTVKGLVELATDGENAANVAVQGNDSRLSDDRDPTAHASEHTDGTDDIQDATASQKGLATAAQITKLDAITGTNTGDEPDATTTIKGIVELATDGESAANVAVQGNDSRLSDDRDPTAHASEHTDGTDDIQNATASQKGLATATQITKLDGIEAGAEVNVNADWNAVSGDAQILNKPSSLPPTAHASNHTDGTDDIQNATASQKGLATAAQITKLDGIEAGATADQTAGEIKTAYESNADTNAFTDAEQTLLSNQSGVNTGDEPDATTTVKGIVELATDGENAANVAVQGNDARLSDSRTPTTHASSHQSAGGDAIKLDDLAAPDDNTDLDASTSKHGLMKKYPGGTTNFLRADGTFASPPGSGSDLEVEDEGVSLSTAATKINFAGAGVTATEPVTDEILVTIPGGSSPDASETVKGIAELATQAETDAGTDDNRIVTPLKLKNYTGFEKKHFDAIVAPSGGDYTSVYAAFNAGHTSVYVRAGFYVETNDITLPDGAQLVGENGAFINFLGGVYQVKCDGSGGTKYTTGTISATNGDATITGSGTSWLANVSAGDYIQVGHNFLKVDSVTNDTSLEVADIWRGDELSGKSYIAQSMYKGCVIENIFIINSGTTALYIRGVIGVALKEVNVLSSTTHGIQVVDSYGIEVSHCASKNNGSDGFNYSNVVEGAFGANCHGDNNGAYGAQLTDDCDTITIADSAFTNNDNDGIIVTGGSAGIMITGCLSEYNDDRGIDIAGSADSCTVVGCVCNENATVGIDVDGTNNSVNGCVCKGNGTHGVAGGDGCTVVGCQIEGNTTHGINLGGDQNSMAMGNNIHGNGADGINLNDTSDDVVICGNHIFDNTGFGIDMTTGSSNIQIFGNHIEGNTSGDIDEDGTNIKVNQLPELTTTQRDAITSPYTGYSIWNSTTAQHEYYDGSAWQALVPPAADMPTVSARRTTDFSLSATWTDITLNATDVENDTDTVEHDNTNTDRILCKEAGLYMFVGQCSHDDEDDFGRIRVQINDTTEVPGSFIESNNSSTDTGAMTSVSFAVLAANDFVSLQGQSSTGAGTLEDISFKVVRMQGQRGATGATGPQGADGDITWEGSWVTSTAYTTNQAVNNGTSSYVCILNHTSGASSEPGVGGSWTTYWDLMAGPATGSVVVMSDYIEGTTSEPSTTATTSGSAPTIAEMTKTWTVSDASNVIDVFFSGNFYASGKGTPASARIAVFVDGTIQAKTERHGYADSNTEDYVGIATQWSGTLSAASHTITIRMWVSSDTLYAHSTLRNLIIKETDE